MPTTWQTNLRTESYKNQNNFSHDNRFACGETHIKSGDLLEELALVLNRLPEQNEVALLEDVGDVDDLLHGVVLHLRRQQEILAEYEVAERQVGERLQQDQVSDAEVQRVRVELVIFQHSQVGVDVVGVLLGLLLNVFLEEWEVSRVVAEDDIAG